MIRPGLYDQLRQIDNDFCSRSQNLNQFTKRIIFDSSMKESMQIICKIPVSLVCLIKNLKKVVVRILKYLLHCFKQQQQQYQQYSLVQKIFGYVRHLQEYCDDIRQYLLPKTVRYQLYQIPYQRYRKEEKNVNYVDQNMREKQYRQWIQSTKIKNIKFAKSRQQHCIHNQQFMTPNDLTTFKQAGCPIQHSKSECFGCTKSLKEGYPFFRNSQCYTLLSGDNNYELLFQKLKQKLVVLLNSGGGFLFIVYLEDTVVRGFEINEDDQQTWEKELRNRVLPCIFPSKFHCSVERVPTNSNGKMVLRIIIGPDKYFINRTFFVLKKVDRSPPTFTLFTMDQECEDHKEDILFQTNSQHYSTIMNNQNKTIKNMQILQRFMTHKYPIRLPFHFFLCLNIHKNCVHLSQKQTDLRVYKSSGALICEKDIKPTPRYKNSSLLIFGSQYGDSQIALIDQQMIKYKMASYLHLKPFANYRSNSKKSIWYFSHDYPLDTMIRIAKEVLTKKSRFLAFISVMRFLKIQKKIHQQLESFFSIYYQLFKSKPEYYWEYSDQNQHGKANFYLKFQNQQQSIFAFIYLDNCRIKSTFIKQTEFISKKTIFSNNPIKELQIF